MIYPQAFLSEVQQQRQEFPGQINKVYFTKKIVLQSVDNRSCSDDYTTINYYNSFL